MSRRFWQADWLVYGGAIALLLVGQTAPVQASDWVEDGVSEFHLPKAEDQEKKNEEVDRDPSTRQEAHEQDMEPSEKQFVPPPDAVIKHVNDSGGIELGPDGKPRPTRAPLEASISTWRTSPTDNSTKGLDEKAARLLNHAPVLPPPKTISANAKDFRAWLDETHPGLQAKVTKEQIVEVKGSWDDSGHALRTFGLPFTKITAQKFSEVNLDRAKVIVINCAGDLPNEAILSLRRYVAMGGFLLTTDWALTGVIYKAFPGYVEWNGGYTDSRIVDAVIVDDNPVLLAGTPPVGSWQLCKKSQTVKVSKVGMVEVLARSRFLMREDPSNLGVLAFTFKYGQGQVLHLVGHFDNNSELAFNAALPDPAPGINISLRQALAVNFLAQALKQSDSTQSQE